MSFSVGFQHLADLGVSDLQIFLVQPREVPSEAAFKLLVEFVCLHKCQGERLFYKRNFTVMTEEPMEKFLEFAEVIQVVGTLVQLAEIEQYRFWLLVLSIASLDRANLPYKVVLKPVADLLRVQFQHILLANRLHETALLQLQTQFVRYYPFTDDRMLLQVKHQ